MDFMQFPLENEYWDLPGGSVVRNLCSECRAPGDPSPVRELDFQVPQLRPTHPNK